MELFAKVITYYKFYSCWVSFSNNLVWTFAAPVLLVCLVKFFSILLVHLFIHSFPPSFFLSFLRVLNNLCICSLVLLFFSRMLHAFLLLLTGKLGDSLPRGVRDDKNAGCKGHFQRQVSSLKVVILSFPLF